VKDISACLLYMGGGSGKGAKHLVVALFLDGEELMPEVLRGHDVAIAGVPAELKMGMSVDFRAKNPGSRV